MIENIKKNIISIIIAVIVTPFIAGIYWNTKDVPKLKETQESQRLMNVDLNTRIYNIEKQRERERITDSIKKELENKKEH